MDSYGYAADQSYSRRDGSGLGYDLDMAASEVTTSYSGGSNYAQPSAYPATGYSPTYSAGYVAPVPNYANNVGYNTGYAPIAATGYSANLAGYGSGYGSSYGSGYGAIPVNYGLNYGAPLNTYGSGYGAGLGAYGAGLNTYGAGLNAGYGGYGYNTGSNYGLGGAYAGTYPLTNAAYLPSLPAGGYGLPLSPYGLPNAYGLPTYGGYSGAGGYGLAGSLIYAAASDKNEIVVSPDDATCSTPAETCPVCENFVSLDVMSKSCSFSNVFAASVSGSGSCKKMTVNKNMKGKMPTEKFNFSLKAGCTCPELTSDNSDVLVFLPKESNNGQVTMNDKVYIVKKSQSTAFDAATLIQSCNKPSH